MVAIDLRRYTRRMSSASSGSTGGSHNINGILYQMLWCLLRSLKHVHLDSAKYDASGEIEQCRLILEPAGGDVQEVSAATRRVVQLKSRPSGRPWSLREVIVEVMPDLYRAVDLSQPNSRYELVTESQMGCWGEVYRFFQSLMGREPESHLDDSHEVTFAGGWTRNTNEKRREAAFWPEEPITEDSLIRKIIDHLHATTAVCEGESNDETRQKVLHLLARFRFTGGVSQEAVLREIRSILLSVVDYREKIGEVIHSLVGELAKLAAAGDADVDPAELLDRHGLNVEPLTRWAELRHRGSVLLHRWLRLQQYDHWIDVRQDRATEIAEAWPTDKPILALAGDSGCGKSWLQFAVARHLVSGPDVVCGITATGDAHRDIQVAGDMFWQEIACHDQSIPIARIAARRREVTPAACEPWLTVIVDDLHELKEAEALARLPLEDWGIRVCVSGPIDTIKAMEAAAGDRIRTVRVGDFLPAERDAYLSLHFGEGWTQIAPDVRDTLRRPLLARLYCNEVADPSAWHPTNEYALYHRFWNRLNEGIGAAHPSDAARLAELAATLLEAAEYPWHVVTINERGVADETIQRLQSAGWLRRTSNDHFEVPHDRLLNFAAAWKIASSAMSRTSSSEEIGQQLVRISTDHAQPASRRLGYVPLDVIYLIAADAKPQPDLLRELLAAWDEADHFLRDTLFRDLLPAVGDGLVPALHQYLKTIADTNEYHWLPVVECLIQFDAATVAPVARELIDSDDPFHQRIACRLLAHHPNSDVLDRLWFVHCQMQSQPNLYGVDNERPWRLYDDSFTPLRACVRICPEWLVTKINASHSGDPYLHDLAYLVANTGCELIWYKCKNALIEMLPEGRARCLATNIEQYRDVSELERLREWVNQEHDLIGATAFAALVRIAPDEAMDHLGQLPDRDKYLTRGWYLPLLLEMRPLQIRARLLALMKEGKTAPHLPSVYQGNEIAMDLPTFEHVLLELKTALLYAIEDGDKHNKSLFHPLQLLEECRRQDMLVTLEEWRDELSPLLEQLLSIKGTRTGSHVADPESRHAQSLLRRMGGDGWHRIVQMHLDSDSWYARIDGLGWAERIDDDACMAMVSKIALREDNSTEGVIERQYALDALAATGNWTSLMEGIVHLGLGSSPQLWDRISSKLPFDDSVMSTAFNVLDAGKPEKLLPGAILAIGHGRRKDRAGDICKLLRDVPADSNAALACVLTLGRLGNDGGDVVALLSRQLTVNKVHRRNATNALLHIGTASAMEALVQDLQNEYDLGLAAALCHHEAARDAALAETREHIAQIDKRSPFGGLNDVLSMFNDEVFPYILTDSAIRDELREAAFSRESNTWITGSKVNAIRGLASFDPATAYLAAKTALADPDAHDRDRYPALMARLDTDRASADLFRQATREPSTWVLHAIGRALQKISAHDAVFPLLEAEEESARVAACHLVSMWPRKDEVITKLRSLLHDPHRRVGQAAINAIQSIALSTQTDNLVAAIERETDRPRKWRLLECVIEIGDPGDHGDQWPAWRQRVTAAIDYSMAAFAHDRLMKRRDKLKQDMDFADQK